MNENSISYLSIDDRPREKLLLKGNHSLSNSELIAILIRSGSATHNAIQLAQIIMTAYDHDLDTLAKASVEELMNFHGIGEAKAISIVSALELGRRRKVAELKKEKIIDSGSVYTLLKPYLLDLNHEEFWMLSLNRANVVLKVEQISRGGMTGTMADPKIIFQKALRNKAVAVIVAHNHPSGQLKASESDKKITRKLVEGGEIIDIPILDHLIFTNQGYYSFADKGEL